jgi:pimeloyl-ACP methyl ester carboxylesterase
MDALATRLARPVALESADGRVLRGERLDAVGAPVLLAHGFGQTRQSWAGTQARLAAEGFASLAMDARGHGESDRNPGGLLYEGMQFVDDLVRAAATFADAPILVGASMGGLTGLMAQAQADCFRALVLVDVTPRWEEAGMARIHAFLRAHPEGFADYEHAADAIAGYLPHRRGRKTREQLQPLLRTDPQGRLQWHWDLRMLEEFVVGSTALQSHIEEAARRVRVPVLLVSGGRSDLVSDRTVAHFLELVPQARHVRLPDATHMVAGDDNDGFTDSVLGFLRAQSNPPPEPPIRFAGNEAAPAAPESGVIR